VRIILLVAASWALIFGIMFLLLRFRVLNSERIMRLTANAFAISAVTGFWILVGLGAWWLHFRARRFKWRRVSFGAALADVTESTRGGDNNSGKSV
jgi:hypothetical protein